MRKCIWFFLLWECLHFKLYGLFIYTWISYKRSLMKFAWESLAAHVHGLENFSRPKSTDKVYLPPAISIAMVHCSTYPSLCSKFFCFLCSLFSLWILSVILIHCLPCLFTLFVKLLILLYCIPQTLDTGLYICQWYLILPLVENFVLIVHNNWHCCLWCKIIVSRCHSARRHNKALLMFGSSIRVCSNRCRYVTELRVEDS